MKGLSVIIPSKTATNLGPCVRAAKKYSGGARIIVIDDGIDFQAIRENLQWDEALHGAEIIDGVKPFVFARNCNLGIRAAGEDDIVLLNDDAILMSGGGFRLLQKAAEDFPEFGCIGAVTNVTGQVLQKPQGKGLRHVHHIAFVCVLIPRRTIDRIGPLDERYCLDYGVEDRDYCEAINRAGLKVGVHDGCFVDHARLRSSFRGKPMAPGRSDKNIRLFLEKWNLPTYRRALG